MKEDKHYFELITRMLQRGEISDIEATGHLIDWMKNRRNKFIRRGVWFGIFISIAVRILSDLLAT